ncbi:MAG: hypothetical protein AAGB34_01200 [Planctomycetota bacterium]
MSRQAMLVVVCGVAASAVSAAPVLTNGSMTDLPSFNKAAPGWSVVSFTPDVIGPGGLGGFAPGAPASPNGGTFAHLQAELAGQGASPVTTSFAEAIETTVTGLEAGKVYEIAFYQANLQAVAGTEARFDPGQVAVTFAGVTKSSPTTPMFEGQGSQTWQLVKLEFTATQAAETLRFTAVDLPGVDSTTFPNSGFGGTSIGVDGVTITLIPSPGSFVLLAMSGAVVVRRRR